MITVLKFLPDFCAKNNLQCTQSDMAKCGKMISRGFRYWVVNKSDDILAQAGWTRVKDFGRTFIIAYYPDTFTDEMATISAKYFQEKANKPPKKKLRKRIPIKQPIHSHKPNR